MISFQKLANARLICSHQLAQVDGIYFVSLYQMQLSITNYE